jgi:hypothetical protein
VLVLFAGFENRSGNSSSELKPSSSSSSEPLIIVFRSLTADLRAGGDDERKRAGGGGDGEDGGGGVGFRGAGDLALPGCELCDDWDTGLKKLVMLLFFAISDGSVVDGFNVGFLAP